MIYVNLKFVTPKSKVHTKVAKNIYQSATNYYPTFSYEFNGKTYENTTSQSFQERDICEHFVESCDYDIFVNENDPDCFVVKKDKPVGAYFCIIIGVVGLTPLLICH